jgi:large subunit ribosomal protein L10
MAQKYKEEKVASLKEELKSFPSYIFTDYRGLNVDQLNGLRNRLREKGAHYHVVKNRYVKRAFHELGFDDQFDGFLVNPTALAYFDTDITEITKILVEQGKDSPLQIKGGYTREAVLTFEDIDRIAKLPAREVILGQLVGTMNAPITGLVFVMQGLISKFVRTLKAVEGKLAEAPGAAEEAEPAADEASAEPAESETREPEAKAEAKEPDADAGAKEAKASTPEANAEAGPEPEAPEEKTEAAAPEQDEAAAENHQDVKAETETEKSDSGQQQASS